jgi:hypothetical protein
MTRIGPLALVITLFAFVAQGQNTATAVGQGSATASAQAGAADQRSAQGQPGTPKGRGTQGQSSTLASASTSSTAVANASAGPATVQLNDGTTMNAELVKPLDARKCKAGDPFEARTTSNVKQDGKVVVRKGSRVRGHVTQAQARSKNNAESSLGLAFDSVVMKNGQRVPLHAGVQALAAASSQASASLGDDEGMVGGGARGFAGGSGRAGGALLGGAGGAVGGAAGIGGGVAGSAGRVASGTVGATANAAGSAATHAGGLDAAGHLMSNSSGVFGLQGLSLSSAASNATDASVVTSKTQNVHLDSGTQMVLRVAKQ